jgi:hypothetical protein
VNRHPVKQHVADTAQCRILASSPGGNTIKVVKKRKHGERQACKPHPARRQRNDTEEDDRYADECYRQSDQF